MEQTRDLWGGAPHGLRRTVHDQAPERLSRHGVRDALRFAVLLSVDSLAFLFAREVLQFLRQQGPLTAVREIFPAGYLGGVQFAVALLASLLAVGAYRRGGAWRSPWRWLMAVTLATALALWEPLWTQDVWVVAVQFGATAVSVSLAFAMLRGTLARIVGLARERFGVVPKAVLIGDRTSIVEATRSAVFTQPSGYSVADELVIDGPDVDRDAIGAELAEMILATRADAVFLTGTLGKELFQQIIEVAYSAGCELSSISRAWNLGRVLPSPRICCGVPVTSLTTPGLKAHQLAVKRLFDVTSCLVGAIVLAPVLILIAVGIKLDSRGPILFTQDRVGRGGQRFRIFKFRTMSAGASDSLHREYSTAFINGTAVPGRMPKGSTFKLVDDDRITRVGAFLRRASLDELPQLINVSRGQMSLVGPRPVLPYEIESHKSSHFGRLEVRPGITGLWQVSGRSRLTHDEMCSLDIRYVREWSLWLDLKILLKTIPVVITNSGGGA